MRVFSGKENINCCAPVSVSKHYIMNTIINLKNCISKIFYNINCHSIKMLTFEQSFVSQLDVYPIDTYF